MNLNVNQDIIARRPLHEELVSKLQELIVDGTLPPGEKVPERALCEQFGVSRTPLREALKVLAAEGLVSLAPNRGAWVTEVTEAELHEIFPVMGALEALAGELAARRITDRELARIRAAHGRMIRHYRAGRLAPYFRENQAIHAAILAAAGNPTLAAQHNMLGSRIRRARYMANMSAERWAAAVAEHDEILAALEARASARLGRLLRQHLENKFAALCEALFAGAD